MRLSWASTLPPANRLVAGHWLAIDTAHAEVSLDVVWIRRFGLRLGDTLEFLVGDQRIDAKLTSIREVDWSRFNVNFFVMLDPAHGGTLPHTWIASFYLLEGHANALTAFSRKFPNLSLIDVDTLLNRARQIVDQVTSAARWVLAFSLLAGALVLWGTRNVLRTPPLQLLWRSTVASARLRSQRTRTPSETTIRTAVPSLRTAAFSRKSC